MAEEIKIVVGADTSKLQSELKKAESELKSFQDQLNNTGDSKKIDELNKKIAETKTIITNLKSSITPIEITANSTQVLTEINKAEGQLQNLKPVEVPVTADTTQIIPAINQVEGQLQSIPPIAVPVTADPTQLVAGVAQAEALVKDIPPVTVPVNVDIRKLSAELVLAENDLRAFTTELKNATNTQDVIKLQNSIGLLKTKIGDLKGALGAADSGLKKVAGQTNSAAYAVTNLSRIVSDSAYGFIGIANNITPFIDSLAAAKKEAQATGTSLGKNLISSLSGAGGLSLAFAAVTTAITFAQIGFSAWSRSSKEAKDSADEFKSNLENLKTELKYVTDNLDNFIKIAENASQINDINIKARFKDETTQGVLTRQSKFITISEELIKATESRQKAWENYTTIVRGAFKSDEDYANAQKAALDVYNDTIKKENELIDARQRQAAANRLATEEDKRATSAKLANIETLDEALAKFEKSLKATQSVGISLGTPQFEINKDKIKEFEGILKKIIEKFNVSTKNKVYVDLEARLNAIKDAQFTAVLMEQARRWRNSTEDIPIPVDILIIPQRSKAEIDLEKFYRDGLIRDLQRLSKKFNFELPLGTLGLNTEGLKKQLDEITTAANDVPDAFRKNVEENLRKSGADVNKAWEKYAAGINDAATGFLTDAASNIAIKFGEALGAALTGGNFGDVFAGVFELLAGGVQSLGEQLIKIGFLALIAQQAIAQLLANPFAAIGVGIALVALGSALKNLTSKSAFATGTRYAPGGMALVGERGPEMINLPRGSQVIPAAQTSQMMGGIGGQVEVFGMLRGQDIYFSNKKYGQTYGRTT